MTFYRDSGVTQILRPSWWKVHVLLPGLNYNSSRIPETGSRGLKTETDALTGLQMLLRSLVVPHEEDPADYDLFCELRAKKTIMNQLIDYSWLMGK